MTAPALPRVDAHVARALVERVVALASQRGQVVATRVTRGRQVLAHLAMDGTSADNDEWIRRKVNTAQRFGTSSLEVARMVSADGRDPSFWGLDLHDHALAGGAVPIDVPGAPCHAILTVSGLPDEVDDALAREAISDVAATLTH